MRVTKLLLALLPVAVLALLLNAMLAAPLRMAPDAALILDIGLLLLEGQRPYVDVVEINPPLIMYLNTVPGLLARLSGLPPAIAFNVLMFASIAWSTWAARRQLVRLRLDALGLAPDVVAASWAAFSLMLWHSAPPLPVNDFGQREHLFVLAWLPYGLLRCRAEHSRGAAALALGVAAGIGACIKPHFLLLALLVEIVLALMRRTWRSLVEPAALALYAVALAYTAHFALLPAAVREAFFGRWLPLAARYYGSYQKPGSHGAPILVVLLAAGIGALLAAQLPRLRRSRRAALYASLGTFVAAAVAIVYVQDKFFYYHQIPALAGATVLVAAAFADGLAVVLPRVLPSRPLWLPLAAAAAIAWAVFAANAPTAEHEDARMLNTFRGLVADYAEEGEPLAIFSTGAWPQYPLLLQLERRQPTRYLSLMPLTLALAARADDGGFSENLILAELAEDLRDHPPPFIVIVGRSCRQCSGGSLLRHLRAHPVTAGVFADYHARRYTGLPRDMVLLVRSDRAERVGGVAR